MEQWPEVRRQLILNGRKNIVLSIEDLDHLLDTIEITKVSELKETIKEMRSTMATARSLLAP
jgi:hypothetical protein